GPHVDGLVRLRGLPPAGTLAVVVEPLGDDYEITRQRNLDLGALGSMPIEITLHHRAPVTIHVEDEDGAPVASSHVRIVQCRDGEALAPDTLVIDRSTTVYNMHPRRKAGWPVAFAVDEGETDTNGDVTLRCVPNAPSVGILVTGSAHATRIVSDARLDPADPTVVTVGRASGVRGRLEPAGALARFSPNPEAPDKNRVSIAVRRPGEPITPRPGSRGKGYAIAADGSFTIPDLEPGRWEVVLYWMRATSARSSTGTVLEPPLGSVEVQSGETTSVSYDLTRFLPAIVRGVASLDGVPVTDALVTLEGERRSDDGTPQPERDLGGIRSNADGKFAIGGLLPGHYVVRAHTIDEAGNERTLWSEAFDVARGAEIDRVFHMR
ncbi:MAG: carboxypeptidase regulatory-like domain-containing protein, partial [Planctomycetes bacterium]|nr:carboxypeptidase regulatory-like domain-containing protein [Planctomycetota bacterium]